MTDLPANIPVLPDDMSLQDKLIETLPHYKTVHAAAIAAGYSKNTASTRIYPLVNSQAFQEKLRNRYNSKAALMLPGIARIEDQVVQRVMANLDDLPKFRHTLKELKQAAGVLQSDTVKVEVGIQFNDLRSYLTESDSEDEVVEGEVDENS